MNIRTTFLLAVVLGVLSVGVLVTRKGPGAAPAGDAPSKPSDAASLARDLIDPKPEDVVKVSCRRKGADTPWVFEKTSKPDDVGAPVWRMTSPGDVAVVGWEIDRIVRQISGLEYEVDYEPGEPGAVSPAEAGLEPAAMTIILTDRSGSEVTVELGGPASSMETYARLAGSDRIVVARADLRRLLKKSALEYRDRQLWSFSGTDVTIVEMDDRSKPDNPTQFRFIRDGSRWMMELPVTARATSKVDELLRTMSNMRVTKWVDDRAPRLAGYGLEPASWSVRVTVEETIESQEKDVNDGAGDSSQDSTEPDEPESKPEPVKKQTTYELHLSGLSPIGEESNTYVRVGDESMVATLSKLNADKFKPVMTQWRDMSVTDVNTHAATRIEIATADGNASLVRNLGKWSFDGNGGSAEDSEVGKLLQAIGNLKAVAYVDVPTDLAAFGLAQPRATIRLTIPSAEEVERIVVGDYTDPKSKRLVYVRRNESTSVAKIRKADVEVMLRGPIAYRDRTIVNVHPSRFRSLSLTTENPYTQEPLSLRFEYKEGSWSMVAPTAADIRGDAFEEFVDVLGSLHAKAVASERGPANAFGLLSPTATVEWTYTDPSTDPEATDNTQDVETAEGTEDAQQASETVRTSTLLLAAQGGSFYAKRKDRNTIYEVTKRFYDQVSAEYRAEAVLSFDDSEVNRFSIRNGDIEHVFERSEGMWRYQPEPDLPLTQSKVENLLLQFKDLKTKRYVAYDVSDLSAFDLDNVATVVTLSLADGTTHTLNISSRQATRGLDRGFFAFVDQRREVFLLTANTVARFRVSLDDLEETR